jgi:single-strand selective monofunctional uracil DNA glycosylase
MSVLDAAAALRDALVPHTRPWEDAPHVLNPLVYAWEPHRTYIERYAGLGARAVWLGMNPGPWGMAQTGVPFGAVPRVRGFLGIDGRVDVPPHTHPKRPITGFATTRVEVSGDRLWGLVEEVCQTPERFFADHFVVNYCPLLWQGPTGRNLTPDKLPRAAMEPVLAACDAHLVAVLEAMQPAMVIGVGTWAEKVAKRVVGSMDVDIPVGRILHPSPASPAANRGWAAAVVPQLQQLGHPLPTR